RTGVSQQETSLCDTAPRSLTGNALSTVQALFQGAAAGTIGRVWRGIRTAGAKRPETLSDTPRPRHVGTASFPTAGASSTISAVAPNVPPIPSVLRCQRCARYKSSEMFHRFALGETMKSIARGLNGR